MCQVGTSTHEGRSLDLYERMMRVRCSASEMAYTVTELRGDCQTMRVAWNTTCFDVVEGADLHRERQGTWTGSGSERGGGRCGCGERDLRGTGKESAG